jgi:hypothetical protein
MFHSISRSLFVGTIMAGLFTIPAAALANSHKAPLEREQVKYSAQWHKCDNKEVCEPGRNIRKDGVRYKWVSEDGERSHWAIRDASASEIADSIRTLRSFFYVPEPQPVVKAEAQVEAQVTTQEQAPTSPTPTAPSTGGSSNSGASGGSGGYAIPSYIVECESGGDYNASNPSGAYGAYQIMPGTSSAYGCDLSTPGGQDACASKIYANEGSAPWVCG